MTTRFRSPSAVGRVRTIALASTLALSMIMPTAIAVRADAGITTQPAASGFTVDTSAGLGGLKAVISGAGDGVNLRAEPAHDASVLGTLTDGTVVDLRIDQVDTVQDPDGITRWWPVSANGQDGWVSGVYLAASGSTESSVASTQEQATAPQSTAAPTESSSATTETPQANGVPADSQGAFALQSSDIVGQTAVVSAGGQGVHLRADPSDDSASLASLPDGTAVELRIDQVDTVVDANGARWWPVSVDGQDGWISGFYLINSSGTSPHASATTTPTATTQATSFTVGGMAAVKTKTGDGANLRASGAPDASVLTTIPDGTIVQVMEGPVSHDNSVNGWFLVNVNGQSGYIDGDLLIPASQPNVQAAVTTAQHPAFKVGDSVVVKTDDGAGLNIREHAVPTAAKVGQVPDGTALKIVNGPSSFNDSKAGWYQVTYKDVTGFVDGDFLTAASGKPATTATATAAAKTPTPAPTKEAAATPKFSKDDYVAIKTKSGVGANVRVNAAPSASKVGYLAEKSVVQITGGPKNDSQGNPWYEVTDGGNVQGWVLGELLVASEAPQASTQPAVSSEGFIWPIDGGTVTQGFGCSNLGFYAYDPNWGCPVHDGLDIAAPAYTPIHAAAAGTVVAAGWCDCGLGYYVEIDHGNGVHTLYGHMAEQPYVSVGQQVSQGETIGPVGSTGLATGPHTHFMVKINGVAQDPQNYLP